VLLIRIGGRLATTSFGDEFARRVVVLKSETACGES